MGMPQILIRFKTAGGTALRRSARGQAVILVPGSQWQVRSFSRMEQAQEVSPAERKLLQLCFLGGPARVRLATYDPEQAEKALEEGCRLAEGGWLCAPEMDQDRVAEAVREKRAQSRPVRAVVSTEESPDCEGVVNLAGGQIRVRLEGQPETVTAAQYCARVAGILAGLSLRESATYYSLPEAEDFSPYDDPEGETDSGRLILDRGSDGIRLGRAVTSLVTLKNPGDRAFQKIKTVEGVDLIRGDIRSAFESEYVGKVLNDYDSKLLLVTAINSYFAGLEGSVLDAGGGSRASVDLEAQREWLENQGVDTGTMSDTAILSANTGSEVFLRAEVRFADAMEDLTFEITM